MRQSPGQAVRKHLEAAARLPITTRECNMRHLAIRIANMGFSRSHWELNASSGTSQGNDALNLHRSSSIWRLVPFPLCLRRAASPGLGRGDTILALLPGAGEAGRRPDEGRLSHEVQPSPAAARRPLPRSAEVTPPWPFSPAREKVAEGRMRGGCLTKSNPHPPLRGDLSRARQR